MSTTIARSRLTPCGAGLAVLLATLVGEQTASAQDFTFNAEGAGALWVDDPQSTRFNPGYYAALRPGVTVGRIVAVQWSYALLQTPAADGFTENGTAHMFSAGVRLRPLAGMQPDTETTGGLFVDLNVGDVRTGNLDRLGLDAGLGYGFHLTPGIAVGPVLRYGQIVQPNKIAQRDPNDGQYLTLGANVAFGRAPVDDADDEPIVHPPCPECVQIAKPAAAAPCPDRDGDTVCDVEDRCPTQAGPASTYGCHIDPCGGTPLLMLVQFDYDSTALPDKLPTKAQTMDPVLDSVAAAIAQDPTCRVCVIGYASEEGPDAHNDDLSLLRASSVQGYLTKRGLAETQIPITGMGASCQLVPESTKELNRRVEFRRLQEGESCPTTCPEVSR